MSAAALPLVLCESYGCYIRRVSVSATLDPLCITVAAPPPAGGDAAAHRRADEVYAVPYFWSDGDAALYAMGYSAPAPIAALAAYAAALPHRLAAARETAREYLHDMTELERRRAARASDPVLDPLFAAHGATPDAVYALDRAADRGRYLEDVRR